MAVAQRGQDGGGLCALPSSICPRWLRATLPPTAGHPNAGTLMVGPGDP